MRIRRKSDITHSSRNCVRKVKLSTRNNILVVPKSTIFSLSLYPSKTSTDALRMPMVVRTRDVVVIFPMYITFKLLSVNVVTSCHGSGKIPFDHI